MKLPNADRATIDPRKVRDYLLALEHPVGGFKAVFFTRLGFSTENWQVLDAELKRLTRAEEAELSEKTEYGQKYIVRGTIKGPTGRSAEILTVWMIRNSEEFPRFVTAYPED